MDDSKAILIGGGIAAAFIILLIAIVQKGQTDKLKLCANKSDADYQLCLNNGSR